ncbi:MAG: sigma-70 family RNA polymerase sigma factor [Cyanobacteriota bacterium]
MSRLVSGRSRGDRTSSDLVRLYLQDIGRFELLRADEELILARLVQRRQQLLLRRQQQDDDPILKELHTLERLPAAALEATQRARLLEARAHWARLEGLTPARLLQELHQGQRARDRLIQANLRLVVAVARKYQNRGLELLDLIQEGTIGLERAVEHYDPTRGFRFSTYAYWWIRQGITRSIINQSRLIRLPSHIADKLNRLHRAEQSLRETLGRRPSLAELATATGLEEANVRLILERQPKAVSLDRPLGHDLENDLGDLIEDTHATPEQLLSRRELHRELQRLLGDLSQREATVIRRRFGLGDDTPHTLAEIGADLQLSRERVRQIESRALRKLRHPERSHRVHDYLLALDREG